MKRLFIFILQTLLILILITSSYYLFKIRPDNKRLQLSQKTISTLNIHKSNLQQNRLYYLELISLNKDSESFEINKSDITSNLQKNIAKATDDINNPQLNGQLDDQQVLSLIDRCKDHYQKQEELLKKLFETKSFDEGKTILTSEESLSIIVNQTNLIKDMETKISEVQSALN